MGWIEPTRTFMVASIQTVWLFTRGQQSVRIIRAAAADGRQHLLVQGPDEASELHEFGDPIECVRNQVELERRLVASGFILERFTTERRRMRDRRRTSRGRDRRRK